MIQLYFPTSDQLLTLPANDTVKIVQKSSVLSLEGFEYSFSPEFSIKKNTYLERFFGHLANIHNEQVEQPVYECEIRLNHEPFRKGELKILSADPDYKLLFKAEIAIFSELKDSPLSEVITDKTLMSYHWEQYNYTDESKPILKVDEEVALITSRNEDQTATYDTFCPFILPLLYNLCNSTGYKLILNTADANQKSSIKRSFLFSTFYKKPTTDQGAAFQYKDCIPEIKVSDFLKGFSLTFALFPSIDHFNKTITYQPLAHILSNTPLAIDEYVTKVKSELITLEREIPKFDVSFSGQNVKKESIEIKSTYDNSWTVPENDDPFQYEETTISETQNRFVHSSIKNEIPIGTIPGYKLYAVHHDILEEVYYHYPENEISIKYVQNPFKILVSEPIKLTVDYIHNPKRRLRTIGMQLHDNNGKLRIRVSHYSDYENDPYNWVWKFNTATDYLYIENSELYKDKIYLTGYTNTGGYFNLDTDIDWIPLDDETTFRDGSLTVVFHEKKLPVYTEDIAISQLSNQLHGFVSLKPYLNRKAEEVLSIDKISQDQRLSHCSEINVDSTNNIIEGIPLRYYRGIDVYYKIFEKLKLTCKPIEFEMVMPVHICREMFSRKMISYKGQTCLVDEIEAEVGSGDFVELEIKTFKI